MFLRYLDLWGSRENDTATLLRNYHHQKITAIGSARHDVFRGIEEMDKQWWKEAKQINSETYEVNWIEERNVDETLSIVNCELEWIRGLKRNAEVRVLHRVSTVWKKEAGNFQLVCWHSSAPDGANQHEIFPGSDEPKHYGAVSVLFSDFVGFTQIVSSLSAKKLIDELNDLFTIFDATTKKYNLVKIKTIGDAYMLAGGINTTKKDHAESCVLWALDIIDFLKKRNVDAPTKWNIRIGIHTGPVIGGVIGQEKPVFDLWGDTVNTAARMEGAGKTGKVNISLATYELIKDHGAWSFESRGKVEAKGKGEMDMYFVEKKKI